jgi:hypothetical protein
MIRTPTQALHRVSLAILLLSTAVAGCSKSSTVPLPLPAQIRSCETNTATVCGIWTLENGRYRAEWPQGSRALIEVQHFGADSVVFTRSDYAGPTPQMRARYVGMPAGRVVLNGTVTWSNEGFTFSGRWQADW